jgi:hypothetical protein
MPNPLEKRRNNSLKFLSLTSIFFLLLILFYYLYKSLYCSIVAWRYSTETSRSIERGDRNSAIENSRNSRRCNIFSTACWMFGLVVFFIFMIVDSNRVMPQPVNHPPYPQRPYPNTATPVQPVQLSSARMVTPPSDYLAWSIANTACAVLFYLLA